MTTQYLTTRELAELLRIKERKVYDLVASNKVPYSKTTGKLLFPRSAIEQWLNAGSVGVTAVSLEPRPNVFLGSHDPLLDWSLRESQCEIATFFDSSLDGLARFKGREGIASGLHVREDGGDRWNVHLAEPLATLHDTVVLHWAKRSRGLVLNERLTDQVKHIEDIRGLRFAQRQPSAGSQCLFIDALQQVSMTMDDVTPNAAGLSESDVALQVVEDKADFAFGLQSVAAQYRLAFVPVVEEHFDLLVDRRAYFEPGLQSLFAFTRGKAFTQRAAEMGGYDISECGVVRLNN